MRAFISYVDDDEESTAFATWLNDALKRPESPARPWFAPDHLIPVNTYQKRLPRAVNSCQILLYVRGEHTPSSNACADELRYAAEYGKAIIVLRLGKGYPYDPSVDVWTSVDFTKDRERALLKLYDKIRLLDTPEGEIAKLEEELRVIHNGFRYLKPAEREAAEQKARKVNARLKELLAEAQEAAGALPTAQVDLVAPRTRAGATRAEAATVLGEVRPDGKPIILVVGPEGVGKTRLAKGVLERAPEGVNRAVYRQAYGPQSFTAHELAELLIAEIGEPHAGEATELARLDVAVARKLELLVEMLGDKRVVVVLDSCEVLLDAETGRLTSSDLDDALQVLAEQRHPAVTLVMVTREQPFVRPRRWLTRAFTVSLDGGIPLADFGELLADLDANDAYGLLELPEPVLRHLHERTEGRPRAAELIHGILASPSIPDNELNTLATVADVAKALDGVAPDDVLDFLTGSLIDGLTPEVRRVLRAVSALGAPVDPAAVKFMLPDESIARITQNLKHLQASHLVQRTTEKLYYVRPPDDSRALEPLRPPVDDDWDRRALLLRAASYFGLRRRPEEEVKGLADLTAEFAEIGLLIQAEEFEAAFRAVESVDGYLENWGCRWILRRYREQLSGLLRDELYELVNLQALGDIALHADDLATAESYYRQAISYLEVCNWLDVRKMLYVSLGAVLQRRDDMARAEDKYREALAIAREHDEKDAEIVPLAGLSDCHRHRGELDDAVARLEAAMEPAAARARDEPNRDNRRRLAEIMVKLGRRYTELGQFERAEAVLAEADVHASQIDSWVTRCLHLDAAANLKLSQHHLREARELGQSGLELALSLGRAPLRRQVCTTLAMCSLLENELDEATQHLRSATRDRLPGHALLTLALNGVLEHRQGHRWPAQRLFRQLRLEAAERSRRDPLDFGALDMEGLARCGEHVGRGEQPLDAAIVVFRRARRVTRAPGITGRMVQLLTLFHEARLQPAIAAALGS